MQARRPRALRTRKNPQSRARRHGPDCSPCAVACRRLPKIWTDAAREVHPRMRRALPAFVHASEAHMTEHRHGSPCEQVACSILRCTVIDSPVIKPWAAVLGTHNQPFSHPEPALRPTHRPLHCLTPSYLYLPYTLQSRHDASCGFRGALRPARYVVINRARGACSLGHAHALALAHSPPSPLAHSCSAPLRRSLLPQ